MQTQTSLFFMGIWPLTNLLIWKLIPIDKYLRFIYDNKYKGHTLCLSLFKKRYVFPQWGWPKESSLNKLHLTPKVQGDGKTRIALIAFLGYRLDFPCGPEQAIAHHQRCSKRFLQQKLVSRQYVEPPSDPRSYPTMRCERRNARLWLQNPWPKTQ